MAQTHDAPQQYKQASRKGKKAWRKNVDISEVQTGLEQLREEIITGGPIAEKPAEDIFAVDTRGSEAVRQGYQKSHKPLKADEILARRSAVPAVGNGKRLNGRVTDGVTELSQKKHKSNWVGRKDVQRVRESLNESSLLSSGRLENSDNISHDLWSGDRVLYDDRLGDFLEQPKAKVMPPTIRRAPIAMTANGKPVKAVPTPVAGTSYNPSFTDWDELLRQEGQKAVEVEKRRIHIEHFEVEQAARIAASGLEEPAVCRVDDESAWEGFESEYEKAESLGMKRPERKNQVQRNRIKRRKQAEGEARHRSKMTDGKKQVYDLQELARKDKEQGSGYTAQVTLDVHGEVSSDEGDDSMLRKRPMRNVSIPAKQLEVVLPDELQDSLRRLKPEGSLLDDRFRNLLVNGKIEARKPAPQRKKKVTYTEKWAHKDFRISV